MMKDDRAMLRMSAPSSLWIAPLNPAYQAVDGWIDQALRRGLCSAASHVDLQTQR